jgi:Superinfection immunity protein
MKILVITAADTGGVQGFFDGLYALRLVLGIYFAPLIVALIREHRQKLAIGILNLFGGWT